MLFSEIIGQEEIISRLRKFYHDGRMPHATMFVGQSGSGNLALALAFAQFISCAQKTETDSCGKCPACLKFSSIQFADLHFSFPFFNISSQEKTISDDWMTQWRAQLLDGLYFDLDMWRTRLTAENKQFHISVYEAQNIINKLSLKSYEGGYKFMIIWMPEFMRVDCANKLLKIVEEPPDNTLFFFVSASTENILPTMLSRVQQIRVPVISDQVLESALSIKGIESGKAADIAHFAAGDWNRALRLSENVDPNSSFTSEFQAWMRWCYSRDVMALAKWSERMHELEREDQKHFLRYALEQVRQNLLLNYTGEELSRLNENEMKFSSKFARFINHDNVEDLSEELTKAYEDIARNVFSRMVFFDLSLKTHRLLKRQEN